MRENMMAKRLPLLLLVLSLSSHNISLAASPEGVKNLTIDQRLTRIERLLRNQNMREVFQRLDTLQDEVQSMRGAMDVLSHDVASMKKGQRDIYIDIDSRIQELTGKVENLSALTSMGGLNSLANDALDDNAFDGELSPMKEEDEYQAALDLLKNGKYAEAVNQLQVFLMTYPSGEYADNAQYWMGEAYYVSRNFKASIVEFTRIINSFPNSPKIADAHLKIGFSYFELKNWPNAKLHLEKVVKEFSSSAAARFASRRIQQMKIAGQY